MAKAKQAEMNKATGEVVENQAEETAALTVRSEADSFDAMAALNDTLLNKAKKVQKAKEEDFRETEQDFWKPEEVGEELRGVYIDTKAGPKYKVHFFGLIDENTGRPTVVRVNGSTVLTREIAKLDKGDAVVIRYDGETTTQGGNKLSKFIVKVLKD